MKIIFKRFNNEEIHRRKKVFIIIILIYLSGTFYFNKYLYNKFKRTNINPSRPIQSNASVKALIKNGNLLKNLRKTKFKERIFKNGKKFINKCIHQKNEKYKNEVKPIISSIIPVYNCQKSIRASINSIQKQNYKNFEIILINDFSKDKTSQIIESLKENDSRIKIVNNKKNMGSLYSRSIGVLMSKGEYIFPLDNDDMFLSEFIFSSILKIAQESNLDIIGFRGIKMRNYRSGVNQIRDLYNYQHHINSIIRQPHLGSWIYTIKGHFRFHDVTIWCKCIRTKVYKTAVINLGVKRYSTFVSWAEDTSVNIVLFNIAQSFLFFNIYGIFHLVSKSTASYSQPVKVKFFGLLYLLDILFDFTKNEHKNYAIIFAYQIKRQFRVRKFINNTNLIFFRSIIRKISTCKHINDESKKRIMKDFNFFFT